MFLHNFWYAAAWDHEIKHEPFGRTVCGKVIVQAAVFAEDMDILEAQQQSILLRPERKLLDLKIDSGEAYARRIVAGEFSRHAQDAAAD
jgi:phenylpropionate dioxygenase-like ring-hydroxylating dioxygenase large terminal subunit